MTLPRDCVFVIIATSLSACLMVMSSACLRLPVTVHPPHDAAGDALPLPVAPVGEVVAVEGGAVLNPDLRQPTPGDHPKPPPTDWTGIILAVVAAATGGGGLAALPLLRTAGRLRTALRTACDLADANAVAETDEEVAAAKARAAAEQQAAGVRTLVQQIRGKR